MSFARAARRRETIHAKREVRCAASAAVGPTPRRHAAPQDDPDAIRAAEAKRERRRFRNLRHRVAVEYGKGWRPYSQQVKLFLGRWSR